jgi:hypothetical protein
MCSTATLSNINISYHKNAILTIESPLSSDISICIDFQMLNFQFESTRDQLNLDMSRGQNSPF